MIPSLLQLSLVAWIQMVMAIFAYIYIQSFIVHQDYSVEMILDHVRIISPHSISLWRQLYVCIYNFDCIYLVDIEKPGTWGTENALCKAWRHSPTQIARRVLRRRVQVLSLCFQFLFFWLNFGCNRQCKTFVCIWLIYQKRLGRVCVAGLPLQDAMSSNLWGDLVHPMNKPNDKRKLWHC